MRINYTSIAIGLATAGILILAMATNPSKPTTSKDQAPAQAAQTTVDVPTPPDTVPADSVAQATPPVEQPTTQQSIQAPATPANPPATLLIPRSNYPTRDNTVVVTPESGQ